jgi:RND family efflux transporter MFP subunit
MNKFMIIMERIKAALSMAGKRRASAGMLAAFLLAAVFIVGCRDKVSPGTAEVKRTPVSGVTIAEMKPSQVDDYYETSGTVKAKNVGVIASKIMGSVTSVVVREGQRVNRGQTLLTIDDSDLAQKVTAATSSVESARQQKQLADVTLSRYAKLYEEKALSRQEFDQVETQKKIAENEFERAKAMLREAQAYQGYAHIRAPFAGVVTGKKIDPGSMAMPGMQLLTVEDTSGFLVEAAVDEKLSARLRVGTPVDISIDALNQTIKGKVSEAVPAIDPMSRTFIVKVTVSGTGLKTGLFARVRIPTGTRDALKVPVSSIVEKGQLTGVYAVDAKGIIAYRLVRTGKRFGSDVEILSGLNPGDKIVVSGTDKAIDGGMIAEQKAGTPEK